MNKVNDISQELKSMGSVLADMPRTMPYFVPSGYFEGFTDSVQLTINEINTPEEIPQWGKMLPYAVPNDYFNKLTSNIVAAAIAEDPALGLSKDTPLKAPAGYFETLPAQILSAAKASDVPKKETKVIPLNRIIFRQLRWAAAAVLLLSLGFGSYQMFFRSQPDSTESMLASVPNNDIHDYLQHIYNRVDLDRIVSSADINNLQLDNKDIVQYLDETGWE